MEKRVLAVLFFPVLLACGGEEPWTGERQAALEIEQDQFLVLNLRAQLDEIANQMALMQTFSYSGMEMCRNDTTVAGDQYQTDTCHVDNYEIPIKLKKPNGTTNRDVWPRPCNSQPEPPLPRRIYPPDSIEVPSCDCLTYYDGPKGIDVHFYNPGDKGEWVINSNDPWAVIPGGMGKLMVDVRVRKSLLKKSLRLVTK
jgi:hypothetical protein